MNSTSNVTGTAADVIGIPFYVWDIAECFHRDVVEDFIAEYAAGRTADLCRARSRSAAASPVPWLAAMIFGRGPLAILV